MSTLVAEPAPVAKVAANLETEQVVVSIVKGDILTKAPAKKQKIAGKRGRPNIHPFAGRITFLREEVEFALKDGNAFIELMRKSHELDATRRATLIADGIVSGVEEFYYTFRGSISRVLEEMNAVVAKFGEEVSIRADFHKVRTYTKATHENFIAPSTKDIGTALVTTQVEAIPEQIYGYLTVIFDK